MAVITVPVGTTPAQAFPSDLADVEILVYDYVVGQCALVGHGPGAIPYFGDGRADQPTISVTRGWPAFPGTVPAIGIAAGTESEDKQNDTAAGGFVDDVVAYDTAGAIVGSASYYSEPLYAPIVVLLIHTNRDERDRLHDAMRLSLFPLRRILVGAHPRIFSCTVDAEKNDEAVGPPVSEQPLTLYMSTFTVHVQHELLSAQHVTDATGVITGLTITQTVEADGPATP